MERIKYDNIFDNGHTPMLIIDSDTGEIKDGNRAACNFYGYTRDKLLKLKITDINTLSQEEVFEEMNKARKEDRKDSEAICVLPGASGIENTEKGAFKNTNLSIRDI